MERVLLRINEAAGPYQMFGELADLVVFSQEGVKVKKSFVRGMVKNPLSDWNSKEVL